MEKKKIVNVFKLNNSSIYIIAIRKQITNIIRRIKLHQSNIISMLHR